MKYKTIILDLDNTLVDFDQMEHDAFKESLESFSIKFNKALFDAYVAINHGYWSDLERGLYDKETILVRRFEDLFESHDISCSAVEMNKRYLSNMANHVKLFPDSLSVLEKIKPNFTLVCLTNGVKEAQYAKLKRTGLDAYFDHVIISDEVGAHKPNPEIFEAMASRLKHKEKESMIIVGDSLTSDILGGNLYGIKTVWFNPKHKVNNIDVKVDFEIESLKEILNIVL